MDSQGLNNMTKSKWSGRFRILNEGRNDFLGFIGALSGQVLLGTIAAVVCRSIDFGRFDLDIDNLITTVSFFALLLIIVLGMVANTWRLYEGCGFHENFEAMPVRLEICILAVFVLLTIAIVPVMSYSAASGILKANLHEPVVCSQANATR